MKPLVQLFAFVLMVTLMSATSRAGEERKSKLSQDEDFLQKAVSRGVSEVKISEHAERKAANEEVKSLARHLAHDHAKMNKDLLEKAKNLKTAIVVGLEKDRKEKVDRLTKLEGAELDRAYVKEMIDGHRESIKLFEIQAQRGTNAELKTFASEALPTLREHLKKVESVSEKLNN
jgi:putative membrane protein